MKLRSRIALSSLMLGAVALGLGQGSAVAQPMAGRVHGRRRLRDAHRRRQHRALRQGWQPRRPARVQPGPGRPDGGRLPHRRGRQGPDHHGQWQAGQRAPRRASPAPTPAFAATTVSVYWHVITNGTSGKLTTSQIQSQLNVLNNAYAASGFSFTLAGTETTTNSDWYSIAFPASGQEPSDAKAMKTALHKGTKAALNLYSTTFSDGTLGYAQFPSTNNTTLDGVVARLPQHPRRQPFAVQPRRHRDPRGRPLGRALPHVPGRLLGSGRLRRRHPGRGLPAFGCPTGRDTCTPPGSTRSRTSWTTRTTRA